MSRLILLVFLGLTISGASCDNGPCDRDTHPLLNNFHPTGGQTLAASADHQFLVSTNVHENSLTLLRGNDLQKLDQLEVAAEPERVAPLGDGFVVTLRGERALAKVRVSGNKLVMAQRVATGAEPVGLVTDEQGQRVFVAASQSGLVEERDGNTLELKRSFKVEHEPRWLALHPSGQTLYVATAMGGHLVIVDLVSGRVKEHQLPTVSTFTQDRGETVPRAKRITGDMAVRTNGKELLIPVLYIDNINPIDADPDEDEACEPGNDRCGGGDGYGSSSSGKRFIGTVTTVNVDKTGKPTGEGRVQELEIQSDHANVVRGGYASSISVHPTQDVGFATLESSNALIAFQLSATETECTYGTPADSNGEDGFFGGSGHTDAAPRMMEEPSIGDFVPLANQLGVGTSRGPSGVAFTAQGDILVHARLDRVVERVRSDRLQPRRGHDHIDRPMGNWSSDTPAQSQSLEGRLLDPSITAGMRLFFSNTDAKMSGHNVNVGCSTCHFDGRNDGLTWVFADGPRQTPSLAGDVSQTEPVTWRDDVETVADEVRLTSQGRMGGSGISDTETTAVTDYINWRRHVDLPNHGMDNAIIAEGKEIFESEAAGCSTCHVGEQFTDASLHRIHGQTSRTPTLRGVAATAPYFHDGSSQTLREVLERSRDGSMGNTRHLSDAQMIALEAYLTSL